MNKDIAKRWVEALRSGKYEQTQRTLAEVLPTGKIGYCCLGVLCELAVEDRVISAKEKETFSSGNRFTFDDDAFMPNFKVDQWAGIDQNTRYRVPVPVKISDKLAELGFETHEDTAFLPELNDDLGLTFDEIADLIESAYLSEEN